jgi:hypothetical protein
MRYGSSSWANILSLYLLLFVHFVRYFVHFKRTAPNDSPDQYAESHRRWCQPSAPTKHGVMGRGVDLPTMPLNKSPIEFEGCAGKDP